ncbi:Methyltransf-2 domain-containing protein [Mycena indigotica]|uniref:Methyltransf-2 domain-containing protein n=1 Tax=Mycena indigotica TaxID=2126181 RepID=A0A8H6VV43_9AGAR|nr:Methyltransf-2 domain-containing protein [Mycena indigotica]KAF7291228.1 Methyltransf-2 domain-containing protein [Mycena indigotica]
MEQLRQLVSLISTSLDTVEEVFSRHNLAVPTLDTAYDPASPAEELLSDPAVSTALLTIVAASGQLTATFRKPTIAILNAAALFNVSAAIRTVSELHVANVLEEAGAQGMHAEELGAICKTDALHTARILRLLATHHIFNEVAPDTFGNNRISSALVKEHPLQDLLSSRRDDAFQMRSYESERTAFVDFLLGRSSEVPFKCAAYGLDTLISPIPDQLPFNRAYRTTDTFYEWLSSSENEHLRRRLDVGMRATEQTRIRDEIFRAFLGFPWSNLPPGSILVDVGGGVGSVTLQIATRYPALRVIVQDLEQVAEAAAELWRLKFPSHIENQMMEFQGTVSTIFSPPQPATLSSSTSPAVIFVLRYILHNWDDLRAISILKHLRAVAATRKMSVKNAITKVVIIETVPALATRTRSSVHIDPEETAELRAPEPLLPNWGIANTEAYFLDMAMHQLAGARERPLESYREIMREAGWKLESVFHGGPPVSWELSHLVGDPM